MLQEPVCFTPHWSTNSYVHQFYIMTSILVFDMQSYTVLASIENCLQSQVHPTMQVSQPQQQQGPTSNSPTILMQQPPLLPQPRPVAPHSSAVPGQPQRTTQLQQFSLQPLPGQQQLLAQPPFQVSHKSSDQGFISPQSESMCPTLFLVDSRVQCQLV
jgi:hypothetical protein